VFGELAIILLEGSRLSSDKLEKKEFVFKYKELESALESL
jgi:NAD dependent epimerase/dehydratase family enzyme